MATGVGKAADRLQSLHGVHLLICIVVVVFGVVDLLDTDRKRGWIKKEQDAVDSILRDARHSIWALRHTLYVNYGLPGGKRSSESESGRLGHLVVDTYLARDYIGKVGNRVVLTISSGVQGKPPNAVLFDVTNHIEDLKIIFAYGLASDRTLEGALPLANPDLGTLGEPQALHALPIEDLARLTYGASAAPRLIVEKLDGIAAASGRLSDTEISGLSSWLQSSKIQLESLKHLRVTSSQLWRNWNAYTANEPAAKSVADGMTKKLSAKPATDVAPENLSARSSIPLLSPETDAVRKLKASISTTQNIEELYRQLRAEDFPLRQGTLDLRSVKVPGLDIDLRYRYLLVVFPWLLAFLLAFKYATMNQIRYGVAQAATGKPGDLQEMAAEVAGTLPLYRGTGQFATFFVFLFVVLTEVASIAVVPIVGWVLSPQFGHVEDIWFNYGLWTAFVLWLLYELELWKTRKSLFPAQAKDGRAAHKTAASS